MAHLWADPWEDPAQTSRHTAIPVVFRLVFNLSVSLTWKTLDLYPSKMQARGRIMYPLNSYEKKIDNYIDVYKKFWKYKSY